MIAPGDHLIFISARDSHDNPSLSKGHRPRRFRWIPDSRRLKAARQAYGQDLKATLKVSVEVFVKNRLGFPSALTFIVCF
jgi:hypothetical protein